MTEFLLGLPALRPGALFEAAQALGAPMMISANALSRWRRDPLGLRRWVGFDLGPLPLVWRHPVHLDSAGFVATALYRGFEFTVDAYMALCAAAPWRWFASMDMCVEPEIARDDDTVLDRISGTVRLNRDCFARARDLGIHGRFVPVIQGHRVEHYLRCLDRMPDLTEFPLIGIGSMCRRDATDRDIGVAAVVEALDRALGDMPARFHLFGVKTTAMRTLAGHPRVASFDSQAYGVAARQEALKRGIGKSDRFVAAVMRDWYRRQQHLLASPDSCPPLRGRSRPDLRPPARPSLVEARIADARDEIRGLHETGEVEWSDLSVIRSAEWAFLDDEDEADALVA